MADLQEYTFDSCISRYLRYDKYMIIYFDKLTQLNKILHPLHKDMQAFYNNIKKKSVHDAVAKGLGYGNYAALKINIGQAKSPHLKDLDIHQLNELVIQISSELLKILPETGAGIAFNSALIQRLETSIHRVWQLAGTSQKTLKRELTFNLQGLLDNAIASLSRRTKSGLVPETVLLIVQGDDKVHLEKLMFDPKGTKEDYFGFARALLDITQAQAYTISGIAHHSVKGKKTPNLYVTAATPQRQQFWRADIQLTGNKITHITRGKIISGDVNTQGGIDNLFKTRYQVTAAFKQDIQGFYQQRRQQIKASGAGSVDYREFVW